MAERPGFPGSFPAGLLPILPPAPGSRKTYTSITEIEIFPVFSVFSLRERPEFLVSPISEFWPLFGRVTNLVSPITHSWRGQVSPPKTAVSPIFGFWDFEAENRPQTDFRYFPLALCLPPLISLDLGPSFRPFLKRFARNSVASSPAADGIEAGPGQGAAGETIVLAWRALHLFWEENSFWKEDSSGKTVLPERLPSLLCRPPGRGSSPP